MPLGSDIERLNELGEVVDFSDENIDVAFSGRGVAA